MAGVGPVSAEFSTIQKADQFYIAGAHWVGILGMAYHSIAAVSEVHGLTVHTSLTGGMGYHVCTYGWVGQEGCLLWLE